MNRANPLERTLNRGESFVKMISVLIFLAPAMLLAQEEPTPQFYLGEGLSKWGVVVTDEEDPFELRLGTRLQTVTSYQVREDGITGDKVNFQDFYARRVRFQVEAKYKENLRFYMDVRNDNANKNDSGEGSFNVGDAYMEVKNVFGSDHLKLRAFRAKVDVSRTETISSSNLLFLDRPHVADEAAQFVSHNRRAMNFQLLGNFNNRLKFQLVAGDGVSGEDFNDATGEDLGSGNIYRQNFMVGGKVKLSPFEGWEDPSPVETYFGEGKHFTIGYGVFHTGDIQYDSGTIQGAEVSRTLTNVEASAHYYNLTLQGEFFLFDGVVENFGASAANVGSSEGYYVQGEYVIPALSYVSPFVRYESWDRFKERDDYNLESYVAGVNWYMKGNKIRIGLFYQKDELDSHLRQTDDRGRQFEDNEQVKFVTMFHY